MKNRKRGCGEIEFWKFDKKFRESNLLHRGYTIPVIKFLSANDAGYC